MTMTLNMTTPNTLPKLREKYKGKNLIEIGQKDYQKIKAWIFDQVSQDFAGYTPMYAAKVKFEGIFKRHDGFVRFINDGVFLFATSNNEYNATPFTFNDDGSVDFSIQLWDEKSFQARVGYKIRAKTSFNYEILWYDPDLILSHFLVVLEGNNRSMQNVKDQLREEYPDIKYQSLEWQEKLMEMYYIHTITTHIFLCAGLNAFFVLHEKDVLVSKITQTITPSANNKKSGKNKKRSLFYRYVVSLPENYKPRKIELNYVEKEWERAAHLQTFWARVENAEKLAKRRGGDVLWETRVGDKVKVLYIVDPHKVTRRKGNPTENTKPVTYA